LPTGDLTDTHRFVLAEILSPIETLEAQMPRFEAQLLQGLAPWQPLLVLLQTLPGIDPIGAALRLVELGTDRSVFGSAERLASWVGICPGNHERAGKRNSGKTRKGKAWGRRLRCEFAQAAARSHCAWRDKCVALTVRKGHKQSSVALAHKRLRLLYAMLSHQVPYQDLTVDYEAQMVKRNAPRWIRRLVKHGFMPQAATTA
jgi:transposase